MTTLDCNLKCRGCFIERHDKPADLPATRKKHLSSQEIITLIDATPFYSILTFSGGEPLLRKDWFDTLSYAAKKRRCHLITNANLIGREEAVSLVDLGVGSIFGKGLLAVGISVNGIGDVHDRVTRRPGSFEKTINAIRTIQDVKKERNARFPLIDIKTVIRQECMHQLSEICSLAEELGADILSFQIFSGQKQPAYYRGSHSQGNPPAAGQPEPISADARHLGVLESQLRRIDERKKELPFKVRLLPEIPVSEIVRYYAGEFDPKKFICTSPWAYMIIKETGDVTPCIEGYPAWNIRQHSFDKCWNSPGMKALRRDIRKKGVTPACMGCCLLEPK